MLDYEWVNPTPIILSGDELTQDSDQTHHIFDHYNHAFNQTTVVNPSGFAQTHQQYFHPHTTHTHLHPLNDPRVYSSMSYPVHAPAMLSLQQTCGASSSLGVPKSEPGGGEVVDFTARIGLNLGGRTYFSSEEDEFVNRMYRRFRPMEANSPKCQVDGCNADLTHAKNYHRRHKVCEFHSKATTVIAAGGTQRFCQQCSRFHVLSEFDNGKRSCRRRLADHNRRRRKSQQSNQEHKSSQLKNAPNSSSQHLARSPPESGTQSSSSMSIAFSPPPMSLDFFRQGSNQEALTPSSASNSSFSQLKWPVTLS